MRTLLTVAEVAEVCRVTASTVRRWIARGAIPASRVGGQYLIDERDLDDTLDPEKAPTEDA